MRAMVLEQVGDVETGPLKEMDRPRPDPGPAQILIRVESCGICRTDLHIVEGEIASRRLPLVPGHQVAGAVQACGSSCRRFQEGDRVGVPWLHRTCGNCRFCLEERENLCEQADFTGYTVDGGYAEYMVAPEQFAYPLPPRIAPAEATPLLCAGVIGFRSLKLSQPGRGRRLALYGFGQSAHITIQVARHWHSQVFVFTRSAAHQRLARRLGAAWSGSVRDDPPSRFDSAIIFAPAGELVPHALRHLDKGGTVVLAGIYMSPVPALEYEALYHERVVRSAANSTRADVRELLALASEIPIRARVETFELGQANQALLKLKRSEINGAGALLM